MAVGESDGGYRAGDTQLRRPPVSLVMLSSMSGDMDDLPGAARDGQDDSQWFRRLICERSVQRGPTGGAKSREDEHKLLLDPHHGSARDGGQATS